MIFLLVMIGLAVELGLAAYVVLLTRLEKKTLQTLVDRSSEDFITVVDDLPEPHRSIARQLADSLAMEQDMDDALLDAVVRIARQPFKKPLWMRLTVGTICAIAALAPASYGLFAAASEIVTAWNEAQTLDRSLVYLRGQTELENPFLLLRDAFQGSALLFFGLAFLWALAWYLRRPEVREARFVRALLEAAARASPKSAAPVSGRLSELIAPDRGLRRPITALFICLAGITAGWLILYETADVRAANNREPVFSIWPSKKEIVVPPDVLLPRARAGAPIPDAPPPSLAIGQEKAALQGWLLNLSDGDLPNDWKTIVREAKTRLAGSDRVAILAHRELELDLVLKLIRAFHELHQIQRFDLIVERTIEDGSVAGKKLQASLSLAVGAAKDVGLRIGIANTGVRLSEEQPLSPYGETAWKSELKKLVRNKQELLRNQDRAAVQVDLEGTEIGYGRFVEVLAAADTACMGAHDCGLPGLGLVFAISPAAPSP